MFHRSFVSIGYTGPSSHLGLFSLVTFRDISSVSVTNGIIDLDYHLFDPSSFFLVTRSLWVLNQGMSVLSRTVLSLDTEPLIVSFGHQVSTMRWSPVLRPRVCPLVFSHDPVTKKPSGMVTYTEILQIRGVLSNRCVSVS